MRLPHQMGIGDMAETIRRLPGGQFAPGTAGKPKGATHRINRETLAGLGEMVPAAMAVLRQQLAENNWRAAAFVLQRWLPDSRVIALDTMDPDSVTEAATDGLTPGELSKVVQSLKTLREAEDLADVRAKMDELEELVIKMRSRA
jgi:hypothetical protein